MIDTLQLNEVPNSGTWVFPTETQPASQQGWYWKYRGVNVYHGPYATEKEAYLASKQGAR